jgi:hypothetical protein
MEELTLNQIEFKWVDETEDPKKLRKGLKLLKDDGGFYPDLERHIQDKLAKLDTKYS